VVERDNTKLHLGVGHHADAFLEVIRELDLVEEDPGIVILVVEPVLKLSDALHRSIHLLVPTKHQQDRVCLSELWVERSRIDHGGVGFFLAVVAVEQTRNRCFLAVRLVGEAEDRMEADLGRRKVVAESILGRRRSGRATYEDEDDEDDIADWGHGYPRRQPERDALPGHGERRGRVDVEGKGRWVMISK